MNTKIISKCLDELAKDSPDLSYIRGMLETLVEISSDPWDRIPKDNGIVHVNYDKTIPSGFPSLGTTSSTASPEAQAVEDALASLNSMPKPHLGGMTLERNINL